MKRISFIGMFFIMLALFLSTSQPARSSSLAPAASLPQPTNISCTGYERTTVVVGWKDTATDETNYRVERSIDGGGWSEVATMSPNGSGYYDAYRDTGIDVTQNRRYRVRSYRSSDTSYSLYSDICNNRRIYDPSSFRVFYGLRSSSDDCPLIDGQNACLADVSSGGTNVYVSQINTALQGAVDAFTRVGFTRSASAPPGSLDKIPINVVWCDGGGCAGGGGLGLSPALLETPFDLTARTGDPVAWLVALHEAFHFQQYKYWGLNDPSDNWVVEAQARSIQDKLCIGSPRSSAQCFDDIATGDGGYVPQVKAYLGNPNWPITQYSYTAALFWTYLVEKFGTSSPSDTVEGGMNFMVKFWEDSAATPGRDGISVINSTLAGIGYTQRFRDIWKDFAVASYAKDLTGSGVPAKYKYTDMSQPGGSYGPVTLSLSQDLNLGDAIVDTDETVYQWGANYYEIHPASNVPVIDIRFTQDSSVQLYYTVLAIKGGNLISEYNVESRNLNRTLVNDNYSKVVVVVAGLDNLANYRYAFNGTQPSLHIIGPTNANKARVGSPSSPDKFRVSVELLAGDGTPLTGVNLANFSFKVGAQAVPAGNILTSAIVMGQEWFVLRAPSQSSAGQYDLQVNYTTILTGTETQAVDYTPRNDADNMLIVDRSGSMSLLGKMDAAKATARLFVDSWRTGDTVGMVSFNETPVLDMGLTAWSDTPPGSNSRETAFNAISALTASGCTNIGDSLRMGWNQLNTSGHSGHDWALVLLSDGKEECSTPTENFDTMIENLRTATGKRPLVYAVAIGPDADRPRMQRVASVTGGSYQYVSTPGPIITTNGVAAIADMQLNLDYRFRMIASDIVGMQPFFISVGPLSDGDPNQDVVQIPVEGSAAEMVLSFSWSSPGMEWELRDPGGNVVNEFEVDDSHVIWRVPTPASGTWVLTAYNGDIAYLVQGALRSDVTMEAYLTTPVEERAPGVPMGIVASLTDTGPILAATVIAAIDTPSGGLVYSLLLDDGTHNDGAANDGLYGNTFYGTGEAGSYDVTVYSWGNSPLSGAFTRQVILSFHLVSAADEGQNDDWDGDGLPNEWEIRYGTDPNTPDAGDDPDNDGCNNACEREHGTNPHNPDTDGGGEADSTDQNPLDPADDRVQPTWAVAYPGIGKVILKYVQRPEYYVVGYFRSDNPDGPFLYIGEEYPGTGVYTDTAVTNGQRYCYQVLALDINNDRTAGLTASCATPKTDPLAPHGGVVINGGAASTFSTHVALTLWASDEVDPETRSPGSEILFPPADSASGVTDMMISNYADMRDGVWEPYSPTRGWVLDQSLGLAAVFVKYRDAAGNESIVYPAAIYVGMGPGIFRLFAPTIMK